MKKITTIFAGLLLVLSSAVFAAEEHGKAALEHATAAVSAGNANAVTEHASVALEHTLAGAIVLHGVAKNHMEKASNHLELAVDAGNLGKTDEAKKHVEAAIGEIKAANSSK